MVIMWSEGKWKTKKTIKRMISMTTGNVILVDALSHGKTRSFAVKYAKIVRVIS